MEIVQENQHQNFPMDIGEILLKQNFSKFSPMISKKKAMNDEQSGVRLAA